MPADGAARRQLGWCGAVCAGAVAVRLPRYARRRRRTERAVRELVGRHEARAREVRASLDVARARHLEDVEPGARAVRVEGHARGRVPGLVRLRLVHVADHNFGAFEAEAHLRRRARAWRREWWCAQRAARRATVRGGAGGGGGGGARLAEHGPRRHDDLVVPLVRAHAVGVLGDPLLLLEDRRALAAHVKLLRPRRQREREDGGRPAGGHHARRPAARAPHGGLRWLRDSQRASSRAPWYATALPGTAHTAPACRALHSGRRRRARGRCQNLSHELKVLLV